MSVTLPEKAAPVEVDTTPYKGERSHDYYLRMIQKPREEHRAKGHKVEDTFDLPPEDMVNSPPHYNQAGIECIDAIEAALDVDGFRSYCQGNCIKYIWRYKYKNQEEDLKKAQWYLEKMLSTFASSLPTPSSSHNCT